MKKHTNNTMLLLLLLFVFISSIAQTDKDVQAKIKIDQTDNLVQVYATATNKSDTYKNNLKYRFFSLKKDASKNLSKDAQSGDFSLMPKESKLLSEKHLNIDSKSSLKLFLFIFKEEKLLSRDTLVIEPLQQKYKNTPIQETQIEISGLILENVMTKPGRDFYDFFTQIARSNEVNYPFSILIEEKPKIGGRNSEIKIYIEDKIVFAFTTQPKEEFLQRAAKYANKSIYEYYIKRKSLYKNEKLY